MNGSNVTQPPVCVPFFDVVDIANIICYTLIFLCSVIGNCLVVITIVNIPVMRTITNMYLLNLAIADLLRTVVCMPATLMGIVFRCFMFGEIGCYIFVALQPITTSATSLTLAMIALERYIAICYPLNVRYFQTKRHAASMIGCVWAIAILVCTPFGFVAKYRAPNYCNEAFPHWLRFPYWLTWVLLLFVGPLLFMVVAYSIVIRSLYVGMQQDFKQCLTAESLLSSTRSKASSPKRKRPSEGNSSDPCSCVPKWWRLSLPKPFRTKKRLSDNPRLSITKASRRRSNDRKSSNDSRKSRQSLFMMRSTHSEKNLLTKRRVIKMLITIVIEFFVCWTPLCIFLLLKNAKPDFRSFVIDYFGHGDRGFQGFMWTNSFMLIVAFLSSCTNPITYCFMNARFRNALLQNFGCGKTDRHSTVITAGNPTYRPTDPRLLRETPKSTSKNAVMTSPNELSPMKTASENSTLIKKSPLTPERDLETRFEFGRISTGLGENGSVSMSESNI